MRGLRAELAAAPFVGRSATGHSFRPLSLVEHLWGSFRSRTGLDRRVRLRRENARLRREAEVRDAFIALASHELRAPAAVVYGFSETLVERESELSGDDLAELHHALREQTARLNRLIAQLLDVSRLDASLPAGEPEPLSVRRRLEDLLRTVAGDRTDEVELLVADDLEILADPTVFERVVSNLVTNALEYGRAPIEIRAHQYDRHFRLTVEDEGDGVPEELVPFLFQRFARGKRAGGSGLGLSIAQAYAQANGGRILYQPGGRGGARFELVLPAPRA